MTQAATAFSGMLLDDSFRFCGGVGANPVQGAFSAGAQNVVVVDPVPFKLEKARELGATHTFTDPGRGGRIHTHRFGSGSSAPYAEPGAMRISTRHRYTLRYIRELDLVTGAGQGCGHRDRAREPHDLFNDCYSMMRQLMVQHFGGKPDYFRADAEERGMD
ncbi:zinc-binding dehydrogenase [Pseudonocardia adelaidensis]|uniref:zinc-binding dehydrogenase n=1 Tax=Pseudonocardia adelaidensis TaxID=648754 RepID=UPI003CD05A05